MVRISFSSQSWLDAVVQAAPSRVWGQRLGSDAARLVLDYASNQPMIGRVELMVLAFSESAIRSYEKVGFRLREILKDNADVGGEKVDHRVMGVARADART